MENHPEKSQPAESIQDAIRDVKENKHQDLAKENLGTEPEEQPEGDPDSPYRMEGFDDKRPQDNSIEKGWTVDSNTSRDPEDITGNNH